MINTATARWAVYGGFSLALITMGAISLFIYNSNKRQATNSQAIAASIRVTPELGTLNAYLRDAETGQRGFLITGDENYLEPYTAALDHLTPEIFSLVASHTTVDPVRETALLEDASQQTQEKLAELKQTIDLRRTLGFSAAQKVVLTNRGNNLMTTILSDTRTVTQMEDQRVAEDVAVNNSKAAILTTTTLAANALTLALVLAALLALRSGLKQRQQDQEEIMASDERFKFLVRATNEAVWDHNIQTGNIVWNDGMENLFGYPPKATSAGWSWFEQLIHLEDRERTKRGLKEALEGTEEIWNGQYRLLKKDGAYASVLDRALILRNSSGKALRMVGSIQDITEREAYEEKLKKRSSDLERFNRLMVGRESKMMELKAELATLKKEVGQHA
jgi:PAS domain S-box-containing protein